MSGDRAELTPGQREILGLVKTVLARHLGIDAGLIHEGTRFRDDLGLDSLDATELLLALARHTGVRLEITLDRLQHLQEVGGLVREVAQVMAGSQARSGRPEQGS